MRITLGVTDNDWATFLADRPDLDEVNFWVPSANPFTGRASLGEPFLFKTKSPSNALIGGGFFAGYYECRVSEAWATFGEANGVDSERTLEAFIQRYRARSGREFHPDPTIGCVVVRNVFFGERTLPQPEGWARSIVQGKTYSPGQPGYDYVRYAFEQLCWRPRLDLSWERVERMPPAERYGTARLTRPRLGQSSFRLAVLTAYDNRCAISGSRTYPTLEAAHIRPYAAGGDHLISNGLSLRSDLHTLYDRGYLGIDPDFRIRVSPQLRANEWNGVDLYARETRGEVIQLPRDAGQRPDPELLEWHMDTVFKAA